MSVDTLDKLLITLAVRLHAFAICEVKEGWRLLFGPMDAVTIHYVLAGSGTLRVGAAEPIAFTPQTIMIVPARAAQSLETGHVLREIKAEERCRVVDDGLVTFTAGDGSRDLLCVCGTISANYAGALGLFDFLNGPLLQPLSSDAAMRSIFDMLLGELTHPAVGTQALTEALMKQCLILVLRHHLTTASVHSPIFTALRDERLARAVTIIIQQPTHHYTVDSLATIAGMSRSAFADGFARTFGESPIEFVQRVRLRHAAQMLSSTDLPVKAIAASIGYASRSSFSRLFRDEYGVDPSTFRASGQRDQEPKPVEGMAKVKASIDAMFPSSTD